MRQSIGMLRNKKPILDMPPLSWAFPISQNSLISAHVTLSSMRSKGTQWQQRGGPDLRECYWDQREAAMYESWKVENLRTKEMFIDLLLIKPNQTPKRHARECRNTPQGSCVSAIIWISNLSTHGGMGLLSLIGYHRIELKIPLES